jgi:hypothetical protein
MLASVVFSAPTQEAIRLVASKRASFLFNMMYSL